MRTILLLTALITASAVAAPPITKVESRTLPPKVVRERVLNQLGDILIPPEAWPKGGDTPKLPLADLWYKTRPRATYIAGLCERDDIIFAFEPVQEQSQGADTLTKVVGLTARTRFRFLDLPVLTEHPPELSWAERKSLTKRCAGLAPDTNYFGARDAEIARDGMRLLLAVQTKGFEGNSVPFIDCDQPASCNQGLHSLNGDTINLIEPCEDHDDKRGASCLAIWGWDWSVRIYYEGFGEYAKPVHARISEVVSVADPRAD